MEQNKEIIIEIFKKLGEKCTSCGGFFIGAAIEASTESGNYGVHFEGIGNYTLRCGKCPECAMECYDNFDGLAPCDEDDANLEEEDLACYRYTDDYQDHQLELAPSNGCEIKGGQLIDLSDFLLSKINILNKDNIDI